jgi:hypothetical protein
VSGQPHRPELAWKQIKVEGELVKVKSATDDDLPDECDRRLAHGVRIADVGLDHAGEGELLLLWNDHENQVNPF